MKYIRVNDLLLDVGICRDDIPEFVVCSEGGAESFRLMRAQLRGKLAYSSHQGAYINDPIHINKCMQIVEIAKEQFVDVLLFPEYSVPYSVLENICKNRELWPEKNKLWVLPCCGIDKESFISTLRHIESIPEVEILDFKYEKEQDIEYKYFVNAMMYLFTANINGCICLVILPQFKTYSMRDTDYVCEEVGLSLGSKIYIFGESNKTILLSLICADVMNDKTSWAQIQSMGSNCVVLNPQLNTNPRNRSFSQLRQTFFDKSIEAIMITCNWAGGTTLELEEEEYTGTGEKILIDLSWSCLYYKKSGILDFRTWVKNNNRSITTAEESSLYAGIIKNFRTEVWYTDNSEIIHIFNIAKIRTSGSGVRRSNETGGYFMKYIFNEDWRLCESEREEYNFLEEVKSDNLDYYNKFKELSLEPEGAYSFPFRERARGRIDRFFDLIKGNIDWDYLKVSETEEISRYTLTFTKAEKINRNKAFSNYIYLVDALKTKNLPPHLKKKFEEAHMLFWDEQREYHNLYEREADQPKKDGSSIYVSYVDNEDVARELVIRIKDRHNSVQIEQDVCIITESAVNRNKLITYPKINYDIESSKRAFSSTDIAGGDINE